ncbi:MAG: filamentous hemagglutinin N-terminal domain-containing protein [Sterolibacteriaceae bacterium MAG5]|nr:filamentous hemagglutinin N-terminal domain-containing protein [Candidatus Nitricoxidireducens bremensis]
MAHPSRFSASRRFSPRSRLLAAAVAGCFVSAPAFTQLPTNPTVVSGSATFSQTANVLTVTNSNGTIINWDTFSIGAGKTTYFQQASASSAVLNRVVTADPSQIYGTLASNGKVWLVNPAGIMVGASGVIDTGGFVGSTLRIGDADFLANRLNTQATPGAGSFVNQGTITAPSGGSVYLIGASVTNLGTITTPGGETILAAGETVNLIDTGTPGVKVEVTGSEGNVTNLGTVIADAGRIGMAGVIVRNSGTLNASSVVNEGGRIFLKASKDTYVDGAGRIVATGTKGGRVEVLGDRVAVMDQATIDASGTNGGGTILVGGDFQGKNPDVQNARITYFGRDALLKADAVENGDGGRIIVWSDDTTRALGSMSARGGLQSGNGGFIETSGHRFLDANGARVDTRAPMGRTGEWLLDPADIEIVSGTDAGLGSNPFDPGTQSTITDGTINAALSSSSVTIQTLAYGGSGGNGNITMTGASITGSGNSLSLLAYGGGSATGNISIDGNSSISNVATLTLVAGWDGTASPTETNVVANKGNVSIANSNISAGIVNIYGGGGISFGSTTATSGTTVNASSTMLVAGKNIVAYGSETGSAYSGTYGAGVWLKAGSSQTLKADTSSGYIALYGGAVSNASYGGQLVYGGAVLFQSSGSQTVVAKGVYLKAGASGHDNAAVLEAYGSQAVTVYAGGIGIYGGGGTGSYNNFAGIQQNNNSTGSQTIGIYGGGHLYMAGGAGTGAGGYYDSSCGSACSSVSSHNKASIRNAFGDQTIDFYGGGNLTLVGGSGGNGNEAMINNETTGTQKIWSSSGDSNNHPVISITGGSSGGTMVYGADLKYHHVDNSAGISAGSDTAGTGTQEIRAKGITLTASGDSSTYGGAYLGAYGSAIIISYGDVTMTGGGGTRTAQESFTTGAGIGNDKAANVTLAVYGGNLAMAGGTGTGGGAMIGSLQYGANVGISVYGGDITMTGNKGAVMIGSGSQTATATATKIDIRAAGNITMTASSDTTGYGDVWVGSYGGALGTAAGEYKISAGRNLKTSGGGKKVYLGSYGTGPAEITLKSGYGISSENSEGGNLDIDSGTVVKGPATSTAVSIQTYGGSVYGGTASIGGVIEANSGSVLVSAYSDLSVSGSIYGGTGVDLRAGATTGGASPSGGNIQLASTSRIDGYGGGVVIGAIAKGTSTGKVTQSSGSVVYGSGAGTSVKIYGGGDISLGGTVTGAAEISVTTGFNDGVSSGYGGNLAVTGTLTGGSGVTYKAYGGSNSVGSIDASGTTVLGGTGTIDILGQDNVALKTVRTDLSGQTVNIKAGYNMGSGIYNPGKSATIGFIDAQGGTVDIKAGGAILEPTGETSGTANIKANTVTLTSYYGGASGGLAISTDVQSASSINATVETAATYGGISIRAIDNLPANLSLIDSATNNPSVYFYYAGPIALTANHHFRGVAGVDLYVQSGSNITNVSGTPFSGGGTPGKVRLAAAGDLTTGGTLSYSSSDVTLSAGGKLQIDHAVDGANVTLNGGNIQLGSGVTGTSSLKFSGTDLVANGYGGTSTFLKATSGAVTGNVSGNIKLNDGAYIYGSTDVSLTLTGTASTLYLNEASSAYASYLLAGLPSTITLDFTNRSTGGVVINGVTTTSSVANGSGLFVSSHSNPATAGAGLAMKYGVVTTAPSVVTDVITTVTNSTSSTTTSTTSSTQTSNVPPPPPPPTTGGTSTLPTVGNQTIGGTAGQFGSTDTGGTGGASTGTSTTSGSGTTPTGTTGGTTSSGTGTGDSGSGTKDSGSGTSSGDGSKSSDGSKSAASDKDGANGKGDKKDDKKEDKKDDKKGDKKSADSGDKKDDKSSGKKPVGKCSA